VREPRSTCSLTTAASAALFDAAAWLKGKLAEPCGGPTVVITHHAPARNSLHPRFADSLLSAGFVSDAQALVSASGARLWIHGHTHDSFDYRLNETRVVCNLRGYATNGASENPLFDAGFMIEIA
jgi:hypothetical protein